MSTHDVREFTPTGVKHTHSRCSVSDGVNIPQESKDTSYLYSVKQTLNNFLDAFSFVHFEIKYSKDTDADTEYLILNGNGTNAQRTLEFHVFSCYCDGDHPVGEPPF